MAAEFEALGVEMLVELGLSVRDCPTGTVLADGLGLLVNSPSGALGGAARQQSVLKYGLALAPELSSCRT